MADVTKGILGTKVGMTQIFDEASRVIPVTVVQAGPCRVSAVRTVEKDGYSAIQLAFGEVAERKHRSPGSVGASATPSRIFKGMKMGGQLGAGRVTILNLEIVEADPKRNLLLIRGAVPGPNGCLVLVRSSVRAKGATSR